MSTTAPKPPGPRSARPPDPRATARPRRLRRDARPCGRAARALGAARRRASPSSGSTSCCAASARGRAPARPGRRDLQRLPRSPGPTAPGRWLLRPWSLDPCPSPAASGRRSRRGVIERAELLSLVLEDLYGPRQLLRRGLLPPEVVLGHDGFLRACDGIRLPGAQQLFTYAADIGRDQQGRCDGDRRPHAGAVGRGLRAGEPDRHLARVPEPLPRFPGPPAGAVLARAARLAAGGRRRPASRIRGSSC